MTTAIHLCTEAHAPQLIDLVRRSRAEHGTAAPDDDPTPLLAPILAGGSVTFRPHMLCQTC